MDRSQPDFATSSRIHGTTARDLGIEIVSGRRKPGEVFLGEIEASEKLHISRTAYREAIRILAAKGLVESRPKMGTRVSPRRRWNLLDPEVLAWTFADEPDAAFVRDLFELRTVIEPAAAAFAAERRTAHDVAEMTAAIGDMERYGLGDPAGRAADQRFHRAILEAAGNEALMTLASSVGAAVSWTTTFKHRVTALPRDPLPDHRRVHKAIVEGDAEAARQAMTELVRLALDDMQRSLKATGAKRRPKLASA